MKVLIGIAGCSHPEYLRRADAQRNTWVRDVRGADVRFFVGSPHPSRNPLPDEVWLNCPDSYAQRKQKVLGMFRWALEHGYSYFWKVDDDVYLRPERLLSLQRYDYTGAAVEFQRGPVYACIGWLYGLSKTAMEKLLQPDTTHWDFWHEDVWAGLRLREFGILPVHLEGRIKHTHTHGVPNGWPNQMPPRPDNSVIASCEYTTPQQMLDIHRRFQP